MVWRIGNGREISLWFNNWIPNIGLLVPNNIGPSHGVDMLVSVNFSMDAKKMIGISLSGIMSALQHCTVKLHEC